VFFQRPGDGHLSCIAVVERAEHRAGVRRFVERLEAPRKVSPYVEIIFAEEPFSVENGMLRPNMKLDRKRIVATYGGNASAHQSERTLAHTA
jgi:hypothetical protein